MFLCVRRLLAARPSWPLVMAVVRTARMSKNRLTPKTAMEIVNVFSPGVS
jgi:hypothetical protein